MGFSPDILASTLEEVLPGYYDLYTKNHPLLDYIVRRGNINKRKAKGPFIEFPVLTGGPGQAVTDRTGGTLLASQRAQNLKRGKEEPARTVYHYAVPEKDLEEAQTENDFANLVESYGDAGMGDVMERFVAQVVRGASTAGSDEFGGGMEGILTFNSDQGYTPQDSATSRGGVFEYTATQTGTLHNLPKSGAASNPTFGWEHQFEEISSFNHHGRRKMRIARDRANQQVAKSGGGIDLVLADDASYQNYIDDLNTQVLVAVVENDAGPGNIREGVKFGNANMFSELAIDLSDTDAYTSTAARDGLMYMLDSSTWELFTVGDGNDAAKLFKLKGPIDMYDQTMLHFRMSSYMNIFTTNLRRNAVVVGGARE